MPSQPRLVLHVVPFSHPCLAVSAALDRLGHEYETVVLKPAGRATRSKRSTARGAARSPVCSSTTSRCTARRRSSPASTSCTPMPASTRRRAPTRSARPRPGSRRSFRPPPACSSSARCTSAPSRWGPSPASTSSTRAGSTSRSRRCGRPGATWRSPPSGSTPRCRSCRRSWTRSTRCWTSGALGGEEPTAADFQLGSSLHLLAQIGDVRPLVEERPAAKARLHPVRARQGRRLGRRLPARLGSVAAVLSGPEPPPPRARLYRLICERGEAETRRDGAAQRAADPRADPLGRRGAGRGRARSSSPRSGNRSWRRSSPARCRGCGGR